MQVVSAYFSDGIKSNVIYKLMNNHAKRDIINYTKRNKSLYLQVFFTLIFYSTIPILNTYVHLCYYMV